MNAKAISVSKGSGCGAIGLGLFGSAFLTVGLLVSWFLFVQPLLQWSAANSWPTTDGTITSARIESHRGDDSTTYSAEFTYQYEVGGNKFEGDRYNFFNVSGSRKSAKKRLNAHPVGSKTDVYYDPDNPSNSVMNRDLGWFLLFGLIPMIFVIVGGAIVYAAVRYKLSGDDSISKSNALTAGQPRKATGLFSSFAATMTDAIELDQQLDGPQKLKPESTARGIFLFLLFFGLVWNGIVSIFVVNVVNEGFPWFTTLFMIPFVLVGLGLIVGIVYCFLALFNPVVEIALSNGTVALGSEFDVAWEVQGNATRFRDFTITIQGQEAATYRQGTDTRTDTEVFRTIEVVKTKASDEMTFGTATIQFPSNTMHTFQSDHNEIKWSIVVHGNIPWWPDVNQTMNFRVRP